MGPDQTVQKGGIYCCLYHLKNKIRMKAGSTVPRCDFAGLNCEGNWHLLKEIQEKTREEITAQRNRQKQNQNKRKWINKDFQRKLKEPKYNKWDLGNW